ncbi:hypothetical protein T492DRAFT_928538, partial [Pavlovales sp. CCMP2436]
MGGREESLGAGGSAGGGAGGQESHTERLRAFNEEKQRALEAREAHRRQCLATALTSGLTAGVAGSALALSTILVRPKLVQNSSMRAFAIVITFFLPFSLTHELTRGACQKRGNWQGQPRRAPSPTVQTTSKL